ncbi:CU044_2847 family protein [Leptolyngbya sp. PCC 6406]|uniref:CU044_2847 family protein n=1 Tax=Leptolyngbya sp. PCC 6406 TaxID=1173264 RepID=UPI0002ABF190|nr:CU044_2847 family protein [Leptolyngbya sp. PCC 6406]
MATVQPIEFEDETGTYTIYIETDAPGTGGSAAPEPTRTYAPNPSRESYGITPPDKQQQVIKAQLQTIHGTLRAYTMYALGAFKNLAGAEVEELKLTFGIKVNADTGIPMLAKGSVGGDFKIEVTCKFPKGKEGSQEQ